MIKDFLNEVRQHSYEFITHCALNEKGQISYETISEIYGSDDLLKWMEKVLDPKFNKLDSVHKVENWLKKDPEFPHFLFVNYPNQIDLELKRLAKNHIRFGKFAILTSNYPEVIRKYKLTEFPAIVRFKDDEMEIITDFESSVKNSFPVFLKLTKRNSQIYCRDICLVLFHMPANPKLFQFSISVPVLLSKPNSSLYAQLRMRTGSFLIVSDNFKLFSKTNKSSVENDLMKAKNNNLKFTHFENCELDNPLSDQISDGISNFYGFFSSLKSSFQIGELLSTFLILIVFIMMFRCIFSQLRAFG